MRNRLFGIMMLFVIFILIWTGTDSQALPVESFHSNNQPIIILSIDKVESVELLQCKLPAIREFLEDSACGLMNVRSGAGYNNTESGYLTLGNGNRSLAPPNPGDISKPESLPLTETSFLWRWSTGIERKNNNFVVPEIGWILNRAESENQSVQPGLLGDTFRINGWKTFLIGDQDTFAEPNRSGAYTIMDHNGIFDSGLVGAEINMIDQSFPYRFRFNPDQVLTTIGKLLKPRSLILVEFGDFARLDRFREEMLPEQYARLKQEAWERLDHFIGRFSKGWSTDQYRMVMISPSLSKEGINNRSMLATIVIRGAGYKKGLLTSGTTNWDGLVANIDLLPSLINMAGLKASVVFSGRTIRSLVSQNHLEKLSELNLKINMMNSSQRSLLDWYLWIISTGWLAVTLSILLKKRLGSGFLLIIVAILPLAMLVLPMLPVVVWQEFGLFLLTIVFTILLMKLKTTNQRYLILSAVLWGGLILDQITGWNLIRFSALGYSAVSGSRYYGIGNEFMGVFLAASLVLAHLLTQAFKQKWPALLILSLSVLTLGWPQLGINFGGTLAALVGFSYYVVKLYNLDWNNQKLWVAFGGIILVVVLIGWWDNLREPDVQTHLGRFFQLLIDQNLGETWQIFSRKATMNLKLLVYSAWTKTILLALGICILKRLITKEKTVKVEERIVWNSLFIAGFAAFLINDSGVVAFGTCLAYGFTYFLSRDEERVFLQE